MGLHKPRWADTEEGVPDVGSLIIPSMLKIPSNTNFTLVPGIR